MASPVRPRSPSRSLTLGLLLPLVVAAPAAARAQDSATVAAAAAARSNVLQLAQYLDWEDVQDPQLSPDGRQIVFTRRFVNKLEDRWDTALWIMNADGSRARFLGNGSSPQWSPDGTRLAYLHRGEPAGTQVFVRWMDAEGATTQLTRVTETPADIQWAPDGKSLAFRMLVPLRQSWKIDMPAAPKGAKWTEPPRIVEKLNYRRDRQGFVDDGFRHLFVVPADGGTPRQVTSGNFEHGAARWTPDGRSLVFSGLRVDEADYHWRESEIYAVDVASGAVRQLTRHPGPDGDPMPSPDGRYIAYTGYDSTDDTFVERKLYVMNADGGNVRTLTAALDRSPELVGWTPDGSGIYFNVSAEGARNLYVATVGGQVRPITSDKHVLAVADIHRSGLVVGVRSTAKEPNDIVTFDLKAPRVFRRLTSINDDVLAGKQLGDVEELWYTSRDGFRIHGWLVKPPGFDPSRKYPLMLDIHGGPHGMYNVGFSFARQEHAANGYVVLYTNPRGSSGYGSRFGNSIKNAYPGFDYDDLMTGVDTVIRRGFVDERNMFVYGCSGGGVLTAWIVGHTDRFAAASANCPVTNWLSFVGTTDGAGWYNNFARLPWEDPTEHLKRSPLMYVGNVKTPTMLMTGVQDLRTPMPQTEEFYQALKLRRVPTAMIRFNEEWHGTSSKPSNFLRTQLYLRAWWDRHSNRAPVATVTP